MGVLVAVEGLDGAGKRTLIEAVVGHLTDRGLRVATLAFPRYGRSVHADLAAEALRGRHGDLAASVNAMALLFALDRAAARDELLKLLADNDIVLLDRYVASNVAYNAARTDQSTDGEMAAWVAELEFGRFDLPVPDAHVLLAVPAELAAERARRRGELDDTRALDAYESDRALQERTAEVYRVMAEARWHGPWLLHAPHDDPATLAVRLSKLIAR
ncbi:dTMP kinase [Nocardia alni]|uniref:dTMP kinase n=1 Tax=Nocardia alni TaxID=2815723 RepID=UPI001C22D2E8|nr:dTMP kinase [Nocardia alni]